MSEFSVPWRPVPAPARHPLVGPCRAWGVVLLAVAAVGAWLASAAFGGHPAAQLVLIVGPLVSAPLVLAASVFFADWRRYLLALRRVALFVFIGVIASVCLGVWLVNVLFAWVTTDLVASAANHADATTWFGYPLTLDEVLAAVSWLPGWAACLIWPLQFPIVRDVTALGALFGLFNLIPAYGIWWERKVAGRIQSRLGPMRVGGWHGWAQLVADGIKLVLKEDLVPAGADRPLYRAAVYFALIPAALAFVALPFGATYIFRDLDVALVFILAMLGVEVIGVIMAGWSSNNKWSVYGAMREACQMVAYEIPMGMALLVPIIAVGTLSMKELGEAQSGGWFAWNAFNNPCAFLAFVAYFIASLASCKRAPFDLPESESELVAGFHTEYSGFRWCLFFFAEYAAMFVVCALVVIVFLGAWHSPLPRSWAPETLLGSTLLAQGLNGVVFSGPMWLVGKCVFFLYVQLWLRWTLPRIRIDQVLYACVQVLLPLTMVLVVGATVWVWASQSDSTAWATVAAVTRWALGGAGLVFVAGFVAIAAYGFYHRRRLVGNLVIDPMPGS
ncbi:MAG: NADH-quinone oxidoreductase subunit NuoH [Phycisphaerae bacterium]